EAAVPYRGKARETLNQLVGGLQSGMSYSGAHSIEELQQKAVFVRMTGAGLKESGSHDVEMIGQGSGVRFHVSSFERLLHMINLCHGLARISRIF
ncbi:MAG TPA: IMP dehydrogenase, partial [Anaerolineales bacterium]|nr:IMP dehydrogenase [Anaerolineales bacterium]